MACVHLKTICLLLEILNGMKSQLLHKKTLKLAILGLQGTGLGKHTSVGQISEVNLLKLMYSDPHANITDVVYNTVAYRKQGIVRHVNMFLINLKTQLI